MPLGARAPTRGEAARVGEIRPGASPRPRRGSFSSAVGPGPRRGGRRPASRRRRGLGGGAHPRGAGRRGRAPSHRSSISPRRSSLRQPAALQRFLIETSILDRFTPALAGAVTGRDDAGRRHPRPRGASSLHGPPRGPRAASFRYHHLFQAFLRRACPGAARRRGPGTPPPRRRGADRRRARTSMPSPTSSRRTIPPAAAAALEPVAESLVTSPAGADLARAARRDAARTPGRTARA